MKEREAYCDNCVFFARLYLGPASIVVLPDVVTIYRWIDEYVSVCVYLSFCALEVDVAGKTGLGKPAG